MGAVARERVVGWSFSVVVAHRGRLLPRSLPSRLLLTTVACGATEEGVGGGHSCLEENENPSACSWREGGVGGSGCRPEINK
jgi:hypothetical protein